MARFSHWEGWYSEISYANANGKASDALRWIGPGLNLAYLHGGDLGSSVLSVLISYNTVSDAIVTLTSSTTACRLGVEASDGISFWSNGGDVDSHTEKYDVSTGAWTAATAITAQRVSPAGSDCWSDKTVQSHGANSGGTGQDDTYLMTFSTGAWATSTEDTGNNLTQAAGFGDFVDQHWVVSGSSTRVMAYSSATWASGTGPTARLLAGAGSVYSALRSYLLGDSSDGDLFESVGAETQTWATNTAPAVDLRSPTVAVMDDYLIAKGYTGSVYSGYRYSVITGTWAATTTLTGVGFKGQGASHDQHIQNRADLVDMNVGTLTMSELDKNTTYYVNLWAHDPFYFEA